MSGSGVENGFEKSSFSGGCHRVPSIRLERPSKGSVGHSKWKVGRYRRKKRQRRNQPASWLGDYGVEKRDMSNVSLECFMPVFQKDSVALTPLHSCTLIK